MNFFGHAYFAQRISSAPRFVLGAMLPDLANMAGTRLPLQDEPSIAAGVRDHHEVDRVFHVAPTFLAISGDSYRALFELGLSWGAARAVAHIATELFLDGVLTHDAPTRALYTDAVNESLKTDTLLALRVTAAGDDHDRFASLFSRMAPRGPPEHYREPRFVREVLVRILDHRPRLRLEAENLPALDAYLPSLKATVEDRAEVLLDEVRLALAA